MKSSMSLIVAALAVACSRGTDGPGAQLIDPPPDSGTVVIDMEGTWRTADVQLVETTASREEIQAWLDAQDTDDSKRIGLCPLFNNLDLKLSSTEFVEGQGYDMRGPREVPGLQRYYNHADGRFAFYDLKYVTPPNIADGGSGTLQLALGAIGQHRMLGMLYLETSGGYASRPLLRNGLFRFSLERISRQR